MHQGECASSCPIAVHEEWEEGWNPKGPGTCHHLCCSDEQNGVSCLHICVIAMLVNVPTCSPTCLSVSRAGEWGRRGVECPELGGEGDARVEDVRDGGMKPRPVLSRPREVGGTGGPSRATLLTLLSISSARSSVLSFSS